MTTAGRLTLPEIPWHLFETYYRKNPTWGTLHIVLEDSNLETDHVVWCHEQALKRDPEAVPLCDVVLQLSKTQRSKISHHVFRKVDRGVPYPWEYADTAKAPDDTGR